MLGQRRTQWTNISPALGQRHVFDHLHDRKRWREMNGRRRLRQTERTGKAICPHLCVQRGDIIISLLPGVVPVMLF